MKRSTKHIINQIKNRSLRGLTQISGVLASESTLNILKCLYKEGAIQSLIISSKVPDCSLSSVTINLRVVGGSSLLQNIKLFNARTSSLKLKNNDQLNFKQVTVLVSTKKGVNTSLYLKKIRLGGALLLSF